MHLTTVKAAITGFMMGFVLASSAFAHHSVAMFDNSKTLTLKGTVKIFDWVNPHVILWIDVPGAAGEKPQTWAVELASPGTLVRNGWTKRSFKPGDPVSVDVGPLRDGGPGGFFKKATLADGQVLTFKLQP